MDISGLYQLFSKIIPVSDSLKTALEGLVREKSYPKRSFLLEEGTVNRYIYYVKEGFCRGYYFKNGREYTAWFMGQGETVVSVLSFFAQKPSFESIEILEDSIIQYLSYQDLQNLYRDFPEFNSAGRVLTEQYYIRSEERAISLRAYSAKERYVNLVTSYPEILQKASLGQIASHLGISQETLSRIRASKPF